MRAFLCFLAHSLVSVGLAQTLENQVYLSTFRLEDGSQLSEANTISVQVMLHNARRLLAVDSMRDVVNATRSADDQTLLKILYLAVAGNFVVSRDRPGAFQQRCALVIDPGTSGLVLQDNSSTQYVILEVLVIVSILCLLRAWSGSEK